MVLERTLKHSLIDLLGPAVCIDLFGYVIEIVD